MALSQGSVLQQLVVIQRTVMDCRNLEITLGNGPRLVKGYYPDLRQGLKVIGPLNKNALIAGSANAGEEA